MSHDDKPMIACLPNGPYYLIEDTEPQEVPLLVNEAQQTFSTVRGTALCRCGQSRNKPFCDGSHGVVGFSDAKSEARVADRRDAYAGDAITIYFNGGICAHAARCVTELPGVFKTDADPWIEPNGASPEEIMALIERCPSGALSYALRGAEPKPAAAEPRVQVVKDGPYAVSGGIDLANAEWNTGAAKDRYVLCRCGASRNKPFCDGSHGAAGFKDDA
jgi:CDGSH-type Zn-finger protein